MTDYRLIMYFHHTPNRIVTFRAPSVAAAESEAIEQAKRIGCNNGWSLFRESDKFGLRFA